jgi:hypothetical protein
MTKCISPEARDTLIDRINKLDTCPLPEKSEPRAITRRPLGKAYFEGKEFKSSRDLALHFPGGQFRETRAGVGELKLEGQRTMAAVFEDAKLPNNEPFSHIYTVKQGHRQGLPVFVVANEMINPKAKVVKVKPTEANETTYAPLPT